MGHKRRWQRGLELLLLFTLRHAILVDCYVGCLFTESLCNPEAEICYDDWAFGRCIPLDINLNEEELYRYDFNSEELDLLRLQIERLEHEGYTWKHPYTQCVMETSLYNIRHEQVNDIRLCQHLKEYDRFKHESNINENDGVPAIAIVKFTPNHGNFASNYANELYYPPGTQNRYVSGRSTDDNEISESTYGESTGERVDQLYKPRYEPYNDYDSATDSDRANIPSRESFDFNDYENKLYRFRRQPYSLKDYENDAIESMKNALEQVILERKMLESEPLSKNEIEFLINESPPIDDVAQSEDDEEREYEKTFSRKYKHPRKFSDSEIPKTGETWLDNVKRNSKDKSLDYENLEYQSDSPEIDVLSKENKMYAEGGLLEPVNDKPEDSDQDEYDSLLDDDLDDLLWSRGLAGFKRRERLDVKKPGPLYSTNNYAFKTPTPQPIEQKSSPEEIHEEEEIMAPIVKKELINTEHQLHDSSKSYNNVDLDYVYVEFQQPFHTWSEGEHVVKEVGKLLGLKPGTLRDIRVGRAEVTFKVIENNKNYYSTDVVDNIDNIRGKLRETLGVEVIRAGIGDKAKLPATLDVAHETEMSSSLFGAIVAAGVTAAGAAAAVTLIIAGRHAKSRAKLAGLTTPDPEASKDYQDLCRARMQAKQPTEKPESPRITSLSRESDSNNAGSNRSSTSSWSDETMLSSVDTSTGHVVLSYMEDHLKNKDRLDQEWAALCAYEADPCETENAEKEENANQNRPGAPLPYDHSRLVLNHLSSANGSDYVNASTIRSTDHDPRNPAYIATQGPLPESTAAFWQMVWEQGSVVIVMLTRLTEEGVAMCNRYWPEREFEQYNCYGVHLLSEYPRCDDYLVRSFYLKNMDTGETRTLTQFHFLSWPENGVPQSTKALLEFRRKVNKSCRGRSCPIVVHCSDGAGRTGTYCLIDMVLNRMMKGAKEIDIAATLEHIRDQRANMVATEQQFKFVFMAVAEEVRAILKALSVPPTEKSPAATSGSSSAPQTSN